MKLKILTRRCRVRRCIAPSEGSWTVCSWVVFRAEHRPPRGSQASDLLSSACHQISPVYPPVGSVFQRLAFHRVSQVPLVAHRVASVCWRLAPFHRHVVPCQVFPRGDLVSLPRALVFLSGIHSHELFLESVAWRQYIWNQIFGKFNKFHFAILRGNFKFSFVSFLTNLIGKEELATRLKIVIFCIDFKENFN